MRKRVMKIETTKRRIILCDFDFIHVSVSLIPNGIVIRFLTFPVAGAGISASFAHCRAAEPQRTTSSDLIQRFLHHCSNVIVLYIDPQLQLFFLALNLCSLTPLLLDSFCFSAGCTGLRMRGAEGQLW